MGRDLVRDVVWGRLREVAIPDSRFHLDFSMYIPDYPGSERIHGQLRGLPFYEGSGPVFVTPDNNLRSLRAALLAEGRPMLMTTYGIARGFLFFAPGRVPRGAEALASTLDGAEEFGQALSLRAVRDLGMLEFLVTGASAVSRDGIRFGKGHGYFDLEWAMLREIGSVEEQSQVVACVHDCQYVQEDLPAEPTDTIVDWVLTPTQTIRVSAGHAKPAGVAWGLVDEHQLASIPPLQELGTLMHGRISGSPAG